MVLFSPLILDKFLKTKDKIWKSLYLNFKVNKQICSSLLSKSNSDTVSHNLFGVNESQVARQIIRAYIKLSNIINFNCNSLTTLLFTKAIIYFSTKISFLNHNQEQNIMVYCIHWNSYDTFIHLSWLILRKITGS